HGLAPVPRLGVAPLGPAVRAPGRRPLALRHRRLPGRAAGGPGRAGARLRRAGPLPRPPPRPNRPGGGGPAGPPRGRPPRGRPLWPALVPATLRRDGSIPTDGAMRTQWFGDPAGGGG